MEKITSFTINHLKLLPGIYVSRKDKAGDGTITTFDIRMTRPNFEPVNKNLKMNNGHSYANSQNRDSSSALTWENRSLG